MISKGDLGNLDWMLWFTFFWRVLEAKIRHCLNSLFQFGLNKQFELRNFIHGVSFVVITLHEVGEDTFVNIELNCIISSGDGLDIEINELVNLYALDIVEVDNGPQINEDGDGSCSETINFPILLKFFWDFTCILNKEIGRFIAFIGHVSIRNIVHVLYGQIIEVADVFTFALFSNVGINPRFVEDIIALLDMSTFRLFLNDRVETNLVVINFSIN